MSTEKSYARNTESEMSMEEKDQKEILETTRVDDKDWFLQMLVGMANDGNIKN